MAKDITCNVNPLTSVNSVNDSIVVQHVSVAQVRNVITSLKDSSPGWDHLSPFVMKQCVDTYVEPITVHINNSFYHGMLMYNNVFNFMNEKELIYKYQFGFRQKHSTQQAIITHVHKITKSLESV